MSLCRLVEQGILCCIASFDPGTNGYLREQIRKQWHQIACEWSYTIQGVEKDIQMDQDVLMISDDTLQSSGPFY